MASLPLHNSGPDAFFDFSITEPTPRASQFPPISIPTQLYPLDSLSPYNSSEPESASSPYSSPSPQTDYSTTNTSLSMSPESIHSDLPIDSDDFSNPLNFASPVSRSPKIPSRARTHPPPRKGEPNYVPRPENAFIIFRKDAVAKIRRREAEEAANSPLPPVKGEKGRRQRQADMSKQISTLWKSLSREDRAHWDELAAKQKREHEAKYPDYRYQPSRPGTNNKRVKSNHSSRLLRARLGSESADDTSASGLSEDLAIVVRATRGPPRRTSVSSIASSASSSLGITLPSLSGALPRSVSPYPIPDYRSSRTRQWVQPPTEDPSPPPSELYFPRSTYQHHLPTDEFHFNGDLIAQTDSLSVMSESEALSTTSYRNSRSKHLQVNEMCNEEEDEAPPNVFVEPITSERNPWTPGAKFSTPRRPSIRSRPRSLSQPHPLQLTQSAPVRIDTNPPSTFQESLPNWSPDSQMFTPSPLVPSPASTFSTTSSSSFASPWDMDDGSSFFDQTALSPSPHDFGGPLDIPADWADVLADMSPEFASLMQQEDDVFAFQQMEAGQSNARPYTIVNLDEQGRQKQFF